MRIVLGADQGGSESEAVPYVNKYNANGDWTWNPAAPNSSIIPIDTSTTYPSDADYDGPAWFNVGGGSRSDALRTTGGSWIGTNDGSQSHKNIWCQDVWGSEYTTTACTCSYAQDCGIRIWAKCTGNQSVGNFKLHYFRPTDWDTDYYNFVSYIPQDNGGDWKVYNWTSEDDDPIPAFPSNPSARLYPFSK